MKHDRNLLFGVLAVQLRLLTPQKLVEAAGQWAVSQERPLSEILIQLGCLSPDKVKVIDDLIALQVKEHQGNVHATLMSFGGERAVHESFAASIVVHEDKVELASFGGETPAKALEPEAELSDQEHLTLEHPGRYSLKGEKGRGGIGRVLIAFDQHIGREIAVKELLPEKGPSGTPPSDSPLRKTGAATARFLREARITGQLEHPGIVPVYELGKHSDGNLYYTMKLVRGKTLAEKLHECKSLRDRLQLLPHYLDLCQTIAYAHSRGVIHRDIKPQNVMVGEFGETVVLDWGLAKVKGQKDIRAEAIEKDLKLIKEAGAGETVEGKPIGTPAYMSPEQADGRIEEIDERSDVWSLGAVLYELLTGRPPFEGVNAYEVIGKVLKDLVAPVSDREKDAPAELIAVAEKCLSRNKGERYPTAQELSQDIAAFQSGGLVSAYHYSLGLIARRWVRKKWQMVATATIALVILLAFGVWSIVRISEQINLAQQNLAEAYMIQGRWNEARKAWSGAKIYYAQALALHDSLKARDSLNYASTRPEIVVRLLHSLAGHTKAVCSIAFSPNGNILASGSSDRSVKLREVSSGKLLHSLGGHTERVYTVAFSPDGKTLASGSDDKTVKLWEVSSGKLIYSLEGHTNWVRTIAFSPDGKILASGSGDNTVKLWEVSSGKLIHSLKGHTDSVWTIAFSPDGKTLASGSWDKTVKLWEVSTGKLIHSLEGHTGSVGTIAFSPDGKTLASGSRDNTIKLWNPGSGKLLHSLEGHTGGVLAIAFGPDGKTLASGSRDKTVNLWDISTKKLLYSLESHLGWVTLITFNPDGKTLASGSVDQTVKLWDLSIGKLIYSLEVESKALPQVAFSPDGKTLASGGQCIKLWDISHGKTLNPLEGHEWNVTSIAFSPNSNILASGEEDKSLKLWDTRSGKLLHSLEGHTGLVNSIAFSPDGKTLASGSEDKTIKLWNLASGQLLHSLEGHTDRVLSISFSWDGRTLASGSRDKTLKLWDPVSGRLLHSLEAHTSGVTSIAFSPDGKTIASGSDDKTVKLWEASNGKLLHSMKGNFSNQISFSANGKTFASRSHYTLNLWDSSNGKLLYFLEDHPDGIVNTIWLGPEHKTLAYGTWDKIRNIWPFLPEIMTGDPEKLLEQAERETGLKVEGMQLYPWNPKTGKVSETPIPQSF